MKKKNSRRCETKARQRQRQEQDSTIVRESSKRLSDSERKINHPLLSSALERSNLSTLKIHHRPSFTDIPKISMQLTGVSRASLQVADESAKSCISTTSFIIYGAAAQISRKSLLPSLTEERFLRRLLNYFKPLGFVHAYVARVMDDALRNPLSLSLSLSLLFYPLMGSHFYHPRSPTGSRDSPLSLSLSALPREMPLE